MSLMRRSLGVVTSLALVLTLSSSSSSQELGSITFPTSGAAAAQEAFLTGVKALHSFQFDEAAVAFQAAQKADPTFAMAYWGEAMSHNHPLWAQQDVASREGGARHLRSDPRGPRRPRPSCPRRRRSSRRSRRSTSRRATSSRATPPTRRPWRRMYDAVAGRRRGRDVLRAVAARHRAPGRHRLPPPGAGRVDRRARLRQEPEASRRRAFHHSRVRRSGSRAARPDRRARLREDRAVGGARPAHAVAHLRAARHVAGRRRLEHRRLQGGRRPQRADEAGRGPRGLPHAVAGCRTPT